MREPFLPPVPASPPVPAPRASGPAGSPSLGAGEGTRPSSQAPTPAQVAFEAHARRAEVWWSRSASILRQAEPQHYADAAEKFAARLRSVGPLTPAPALQETIHEERQFLNLLQRRYSDIPPLLDLVEQIDDDLRAVQDQITEVGPSPDPRKGSSSQGDGIDHP